MTSSTSVGDKVREALSAEAWVRFSHELRSISRSLSLMADAIDTDCIDTFVPVMKSMSQGDWLGMMRTMSIVAKIYMGDDEKRH